jgi:hypothetical protein
MAIINPNVVPNASLSSPLITPGWPLVVVPQSSPIATVIQAEKPAPAHIGVSTTLAAVLTASGHIADRVI